MQWMTSESLRERLLASYSTIANGTNAAFYYEEAMKHDFVYSVGVIPRARGIGTVDVVAAGKGRLLSEDCLALIAQDLAGKKEICVEVAVRSPSLVVTDVIIDLHAKEEYGFDETKAALEAYITEYIASLKIGEPLLVSRLCAGICALDGVHNHKVTSPVQDITAAADELIVLGSVTINRMAQPTA